MKSITIKSLLIAIAFISAPLLQSFTYSEDAASARILWIDLAYDFGSIEKGIPATHDFEFTNEGDAPLLISDVKASCGCTVPAYPKNPIMPGESEIIKVTYNAAKSGAFKKSVTVFSNANTSAYQLSISGEVISQQ